MPVDPLSELAHRILRINAERAYTLLVPSVPGSSEAKALLDGIAPVELLAQPASDSDQADLLRAALYLWHDHLGESHRISQAMDNSTAAFWHAIMHRREGDFQNSKYWYHRCVEHPVMAMIAARANPVINPLPADKAMLKLTLGGWNPHSFVDLVETISKTPGDPRRQIIVSLQKLEWRILFDHTAREAAQNSMPEMFRPKEI